MGLIENQWAEAQSALIGAVLIYPELAAELVAGTDAGDYTDANRVIFETIVRQLRAGVEVDSVTVLDEIGAGYKETVLALMDRTPNQINLKSWIPICKTQARLTKLRGLAARLLGEIDMEGARGVLAQMQELTVEQSSVRVQNMTEALGVFFDQHQAGKKEYIKFGIQGIDANLCVDRGDVVVLGGYPSDGKSAMMLQMAYYMAKSMRVGIFSFETNAAKLTDRLVSHATFVPLNQIKHSRMTAAEWRSVVSFSAEITQSKLEIIEAAGMTVDDILGLALARRYDAIFVDYMQLISPPAGVKLSNRTETVTAISNALHVMAQRHKILVVELSQLRRPQRLKDGTYPPPGLSDLRESGQIEQDADVVMFLYRIKREDATSARELFIAKNKEGTLGTVELAFAGEVQTFFGGKDKNGKVQYPRELIRHERERRARERSGEAPPEQTTIYKTD